MGGDRAPAEIVAGALQAAEAGLAVVLVGDPDRLGDTGGLPVIAAREIIEMDEDPAGPCGRRRTRRWSGRPRRSETGRRSAMVSAGNTGATMASALFRMGRIRGVARPAIATPIPVPGTTPTVLLDAGANAECTAGWLVQFAQMGSAFAKQRFGIADPRVGLAVDRRGAGQGQPPGQGDVRPARRGRGRARRALHRQRRRPGPHVGRASTWSSPTASPATSS